MFYPVGCECPAKQSFLMSSSATFARLQVGTVDFVSRPLVLRHSDKRRVVMDLNICFTYVCSLVWINLLRFVVLLLSEQF
jgi:hypothetical protein